MTRHQTATATASTPPPCSPPSTRSRPRPRRPSSSSGPTTSGSAARTTAAPSTASSASVRSAARAHLQFDADHPAVLVGRDNGPTPVEFVLHALAACLTAGLANIAAARGIRLTEVRSTVAGDIDLNGILGLDPAVRNGYEKIAVRFTVKGDAPPRSCARLVEQSRARSAVYDVITNGVPVSIEVDGLHEADVAPAVGPDPILGSASIASVGIDADDPAAGTDRRLDQREVQTRAACDVNHAVTRAKVKACTASEALCSAGGSRARDRAGRSGRSVSPSCGRSRSGRSRVPSAAHGVPSISVASR